jgi:AhpD family alkylhydroperoxidase
MIKYIHPVPPKKAEGLVKPVYYQIERDFGKIVEPFLLHSQLPELLAGAWMACRETELVGSVPRSIKEAVAAAVSSQNQCLYCVDAHAIMLRAGGAKKLAEAMEKSKFGEIEDEQTRAIVNHILGVSGAAFTSAEAPEIVGTAVYFHYINRMANVLLSETPLPSSNRLLRGGMMGVAASMFSDAVKLPKTTGDSLEFLPEAELPADLGWAKGAANVAGAFARFAKAVEIDGEYALPVEVRLLVEEQVSHRIAAKDFTAKEATELAITLHDEALETAAKLTLLSALASYKVDEQVVTAFHKHYPEDEKLLGALAWASFTAARKIGIKLTER